MRWVFSLVFVLALVSSPRSCFGSDPVSSSTLWVAHILRAKSSKKYIPILELTDKAVPVVLVPSEGILRPTIEFKGHLTQENWTLQIRDSNSSKMIPVNPSQEFSFHLFITGRLSDLELVAVSPSGQIFSEQFYIFAPNSDAYLRTSPWNAVVLGLGLTGLGYYQTDYGLYKGLMSCLSIRYAPTEGDSNWSWLGHIDMTVQSLYSEPALSNPQILSAKLDGMYRLPPIYDFRLSEQIVFGFNYMTILSNGSPFGFRNLVSPELGWRLRWRQNSVDAYSGEMRFMALSQDLLKQRGLEVSTSWTRSFKNRHNLELSFVYNGFIFQSSYNNEVKVDSVSLKIGYSL